MFSNLIYFSAVLFYGLIGWYFWRAKWNAPEMPARGIIVSSDWVSYLIFVPLILHGYTLHQSIFVNAGLSFGVGNAISSIVWLTALIYWISGFSIV